MYWNSSPFSTGIREIFFAPTESAGYEKPACND